MHGSPFCTHSTPQTVITTWVHPAKPAHPGVMGIVPGGHVPVHVVGGVGGKGGGDGINPPICIGGSCCCCWFWVWVSCCVVGGGDVTD